jgi:hypothetical protein
MMPLHVYRAICLAGAVVGVLTAAYFFAAGDAFMGWFFVVLTLLLAPAYLAYAAAVRRRGG